MEPGHYTKTEIQSQPEAWVDAIRAVNIIKREILALISNDFDQILFTGCGSTYYLSLSAAALYQELSGRISRGIPASELLLNSKTVMGHGKTLLIAVSRSGSTTETVRAVEQFRREKRGPVIAITNYGDQPLASLADLAVVIEKGQEKSVAQTRSFASMYVASTALAALAGDDASLLEQMNMLPEAGKKLIGKGAIFANDYGTNLNLDRFYFLGSGLRYGLACEVNLKMKEMSLTHSEPFHFLEFRHGPMSMVMERALVVGLLSEKNARYERAVLEEMGEKGANILSLGKVGADITFDANLPESISGVLYLPVLQSMALARSLAKGLDPDRPANLSAVITLDL